MRAFHFDGARGRARLRETGGRRRAIALRSARNEYAEFGVTFSGGSQYPGQPVFPTWTSLGNVIASKPLEPNRFLISTFRQSSDDAFLDIVESFANPVKHAEGDLVFNPSPSAIAIAYDAADHAIEENRFATGSVSWVGGRFVFDSRVGISSSLLRTGIPKAQVGLDDLLFRLMPAPEPATAGSVLSVIVSLAIAVRRSRCARLVPCLPA